VFAFLLVEILPIFNLPAVDFKNAWPLDYDFLFDWNVVSLLNTESYGKFGVYVLVWGVLLALVVVPVMVMVFGKRWYCSWVCGCGGLAETLGDPYRQHSSKSLISWQLERIIIYSVLIFAVVMTAFVGIHSYNVVTAIDPNEAEFIFFGVSTYDIRMIYGFLIGSIFSGVIGTGFYPIFGNRVWCRFGCPLAAFMGIIQRFHSRFRITTNGSQCISCGNCSTYCEQGIDVRWYAQRGQDIVRSSCVGCGVCSAVCPRGVLKLENQPDVRRGDNNPIMITNEGIILHSPIDLE
jgi:ferredoxin-type protein NapH